MRKKANAERKLSPPATHSYLEEQRTLVLSLRTGRPEPVGQRAGLGGGHKVAQGQGLLEEWDLVVVRALALWRGRGEREGGEGGRRRRGEREVGEGRGKRERTRQGTGLFVHTLRSI